jgi:ABC-type dipeptide/oligopeptide/nickel transport system ATPase component
VIGVCGDQGAGKSVFMTALFRTVHTLRKGIEGFIGFDNKSGAGHFTDIEE